MKKILAIITLLFTSVAHAEVRLPEGCYVTYDDPYECFYIPQGEILSWNEGPQQYVDPLYGEAIGLVIENGWKWKNATQTCNANYGNLNAQFVATEANRQEWIVFANAQKKLASKLRKACGTKCRRIK